MSIWKLLLAEIRFRKLNFAMSLLAVTIAVTLFVAGPVLIDGYGRQTRDEMARLEDQTRVLMRDMGFNLLIVPKETDMSDFWAEDFAAETMPQEYVDRLANDPRLTLVNHLVATLQKRVEWNGRKVLLQGYLPEVPQPHRSLTAFAQKYRAKKQSTMGPEISPGTVWLGYELGRNYKAGDAVEVLGRQFIVAQVQPEKGSKDDIAIMMHLSDAQEVLQLPGRINQILALECQCAGKALSEIRRQLQEVLPEAQVTEYQSIALARAEQRNAVGASRQKVQQLLETLASVITPIVVLASVLWVGLLALANVRERRTEIGLLRALGKGSATIAALFLGKAMVLGLIGGALGFALGTMLARWLGVQALELGTDYLAFRYDVLLAALVGAPLLAAVASYLPTTAALSQDPAVVLQDR